MSRGIYFAFAAALISGFAIFFNKFSLGFWHSSSVFTTAKNLVAVLFLVSVIFMLKKWQTVKNLSRKQWLQLILVGFVGGSVPFLLFFKGLSLTTATNAAFLHKTLFIWVVILAAVFLKEKISGLQVLALGILLAGVYLFVAPEQIRLGIGELLVFCATLLWTVENIIAKFVLKNMSPLILGWGRMFFGSVVLSFFLVFTGQAGGMVVGSFNQLALLLLSGFVLFGYVWTWYSALKYAPATVVSSVLVLGAPVTALLNYLFVTHELNAALILPVVLIFSSVAIITKFANIFHERTDHVCKIRTSS